MSLQDADELPVRPCVSPLAQSVETGPSPKLLAEARAALEAFGLHDDTGLGDVSAFERAWAEVDRSRGEVP